MPPTHVRELMTADPVALETSAPVMEAAKQMRDHHIGDVLVVDGPTLRGIVTDRDIATRVTAEGQDPNTVTVGDICSTDLETVGPDDEVADVIVRMREAAIRRIPVVEDGVAVGVLSLGDLAMTYDDESVLADISAAPADSR